MSAKRVLPFILAATFAAFVAGCGKAPDVASPICSDLDKVTDPVQKAELAKKCPRSGSEFKPSAKKEW